VTQELRSKSVTASEYFLLFSQKKKKNFITLQLPVHAFVTSRLDNCNVLLSGCPKNSLKSLRLIQNAAARDQMRISRRDHISPDLASLHWLPVKLRI